jgi:hypothetical protein
MILRGFYILVLFFTTVVITSFTVDYNNPIFDEINFPLLDLKNKKVENKIYKCLIDSINNSLFSDDTIFAKNRNEIIQRFKSEKEVSFNVSHEISSSKNTISIVLNYNWEYWNGNGWDSEYYVFDSRNGNILKLSETIKNTIKFDSILNSKIQKYKIDYVNKMKNDEYYEITMEELKRCFYNKSFQFKGDSLFVYPDCEFPRVNKALEPIDPIKIQKKELKNILKREYY